MAYDHKVKFLATNLYGCGPAGHDDVYTVDEFREQVRSGGFVDHDGYGHPVKDGKTDLSVIVKPSRVDDLPVDATHVVWYNK